MDKAKEKMLDTSWLKASNIGSKMTNGIAQVAAASTIVETFLGWIPCLALQMTCRHILTQESLHRLQQQLAQVGLDLPFDTPLRFGIQIKLLKALALSEILRCNDSDIEGSWWHRKISPQIELRVALRYQVQRPARPWYTINGRAHPHDQLSLAFPHGAFATILPRLADHGRNFYRHRVTTRSRHDYGYNIQGLRLEVTSLYCVVLGFELCLRVSVATPFGPDDDSNNSDTNSG